MPKEMQKEIQKKEVGGQAVIEGVMMRSKRDVVTAIRKNGKIVYKKERLKKKSGFMQLFFIRGIVSLIEMLVIGIKTLNWSASMQSEDGEELSSWAVTLTLIAAFAFAIILFMVIPYTLAYLTGIKETKNPVWFNITDGLIKAGMLILYLYLISLMKEVRTVFQYHGAEHKAISCYEGNQKLTVQNAKKYPTIHPRCGTAFLMLVILISIFLFSFIPFITALIYPGINSLSWLLRRIILFAARIMLLPIVAGFSYEALKFGARHQDNLLFSSLTLPGLWIQRLTAKEPTSKQLEVGIAALRKVLEASPKQILR